MDTLEIQADLKERFEQINFKAQDAAKKAGRNFEDIKIIAVSKTHPAKVLECAFNAGIRTFGENYVQELTDKYEIMHDKGYQGLTWHFIGHLQTNKVRFIAPFVDYIHSVDSYKLAEEINKRAEYFERRINILIQVNTSGEYSKSGCDPDDTSVIISQMMKLSHIDIQGLMTIGTFTDNEKIQRAEFSLLRNILSEVNSKLGTNLKELSMGMTSDYEIAIDEGATMVRVGTAIFGNRTYKNFG